MSDLRVFLRQNCFDKCNNKKQFPLLNLNYLFFIIFGKSVKVLLICFGPEELWLLEGRWCLLKFVALILDLNGKLEPDGSCLARESSLNWGDETNKCG